MSHRTAGMIGTHELQQNAHVKNVIYNFLKANVNDDDKKTVALSQQQIHLYICNFERN